jgi:hypothetical protein
MTLLTKNARANRRRRVGALLFADLGARGLIALAQRTGSAGNRLALSGAGGKYRAG